MNTAKLRRMFAGAAMVTGFAAAGLIVGYGIGKVLKAGGTEAAPDPWVLFAAPLIAWGTIAWHELGHLAGGWVSGFRTALFAVGPLKIERVHGRLQAGYNRSFHLWGGVAAAAPGQRQCTAESVRRSMLRIVAGGPLFSLMFALLLIPAMRMFESSPNAAALLGMTGLLSLFIGLATMVPSSMGGFQSDGMRLIQLLRGGERAERLARLGMISGLSIAVRPREWPGELMAAIASPGDRTFDGVSAAWLRACHYEDCGELDHARVWIEEALAGEENWPKPLRPVLHSTAAYIYANAGEPALGRLHFERSRGPSLLSKEQLLQTEAAVLLGEDRCREAIEAAARALDLIPRNASGQGAWQREQLDEIVRKAANRAGAAA